MDLSLYLVTDSVGINDEDFYRTVEEAVSAGVTFVQLREKNMDTLKMYEKALKVKQICDKYNATFVINDRLDIAQAVDADGVHIGTSDLPVAVARKILGKDKIIGVTTKDVKLAKQAVLDGADYFGIGAFFSTSTKTDADLLTLDEIKEVVSSVDIPFVGIGGLKADNLDILKDTGIKGVAISSAIMRADDVSGTVKKMKAELDEIVK